MRGVDTPTAEAAGAAAVHVQALSGAGAPRDDGAFAGVFDAVFRSMREEAASASRRPGTGIISRSQAAREALRHSPLRPKEREVAFARMFGGTDATQTGSAGTVDSSAPPWRISRSGPTQADAASSGAEITAPEPQRGSPQTSPASNALALEWVPEGGQQSSAGAVHNLLFEQTPEGKIQTLDFTAIAGAKGQLWGQEAGAENWNALFVRGAQSTPGGPGSAGGPALYVAAGVNPQEIFLAGDIWSRGSPDELLNPAHVVSAEPADAVSPQALPEQLAPQAVIRAAGVAREQLIDQLVRSVRLLQHDKATEVLVQLKPDFLGRVSVRILVDKHGMTIEIKAGNEAVRQVMQDSLADLQQRLSEKGIAFDQLSVFADTGSNPRGEPAWPNEASTVRREPEEKLAAEMPLERVPSVKSGKIDYLA